MKRIISLIITLIIVILSVISPSVYADSESKVIEKEINILNQLGFINKIPNNVNDNLSRGEFTSILISIMNGKFAVNDDVEITDINKFHDYYPAMSCAIKLGLISGPSTRADDNITYNEAIKMVVCMVGYNQYALHKGGWPTGYISIAQSIGLLDGINMLGDTPITWEDVIILLYNAICTDVLEPVSIGEDTTYGTIDGRTILTQSHNIVASEGVVETIKGRSLENDDTVNDNQVIIDGVRLNSDFINLSEYIGMNVIYYYNQKEKSLCAIYPESNKVLKVNAEYVYDFNDGKITYDEFIPEKNTYVEKEVVVSPLSCIMYNDVVIDSFDSSYFLDKQGEFTFIDNNSDGKFDVVILDVTEDYVVGKFDKHSDTIYDFYDEKKNFSLSDKNGVDVSFIDNYGRQMYISELMRYDVISVKKSFDGKKITAIFSNNEVRGTIDESYESNGKTYIKIKGVEYETTVEFSKYEKVKIGEWGVFGLTATGKIACINRSFTSEGSFYGYLIAASKENGLDAGYLYKILSENGNIEILTAAKKVTLDGISMNSEEAYNELGGENVLSQPVIYSINSEGMLKSVDTINYNEGTEHRDSLREMYNCYDSSYDEEGGLIETERTTLEWRSGIFGSKIATHGGTILFRVASSKNASDKEYGVSSISALSGNYFAFKAYKANEASPVADIIVMYSENASISSDTNTYLISNITEGIDDDGNPVTKLYTYKGRNEATFFVKDKSVFSLAKWYEAESTDSSLNHKFVPGDIITISTDRSGYVDKIELVFDMTNSEFYTSTYCNTEAANALFRISFNEVYLNYSGTLQVYKGPIPEGTESLGYDNLETYDTSDFTVLVFDPDNRSGNVTIGNISDLSDYKTTGKGSMIFLKTTYTYNGFVVVYRNLQ